MKTFNEKGFSGRIYFFKNIKYGSFISVGVANMGSDYVCLGHVDVSVEFDIDTRQAEIDAIEKQMRDLKAETQHRLNQMQGRIQELQAITQG